MLRFFRQIRHRLLIGNKFNKYLLYAIGEILLVVIGILIALQIDNWNEKQKQKEQFLLNLQQAYTSIDLANQNVELSIGHRDMVLQHIDQLLEHPEEISNDKLPFILFYVDKGLDELNASIYEIDAPDLRADPNDIGQIKLAKEVSSYFERKIWQSSQLDSLLTPILYESGLPIPNIAWGISEHVGFNDVDTTFFSIEEQDIARALLSTPAVRKALRTLKSGQIQAGGSLTNTLNDGKSVQLSIKSYFPDVRLLYKDVGILGTSINGYVNVASTPMKQTDAEKSIWELELFLKEGSVKFRTGDSWNYNWGGDDFPEGKARYFWGNIPVKAGKYHILLNLEEKTYEFNPVLE